MELFAKLSDSEKKIYFEKASSITGLSTQIIEKDFWVSWVLKRMFSIPALQSNITFKGGTSLSKAYGLIQRFSEDIDISIDRAVLGFVGEKDPVGKSREKREKLLAELKEASQKFVQKDLLEQLRKSFEKHLDPSQKWKLEIDPQDVDEQTLSFEYPAVGLGASNSYLKKLVKLEFGTRGERWPFEKRTVAAYVAKVEPSPMEQSNFEVQVLDVKRTFWEKATILHQIHYWPEDKDIPLRYSRHYYDLFCIMNSEVRSKVIKESDLLEKVAEHKRLFFRSAAAKYELAKKGTLKLSPTERAVKVLEKDYKSMEEMLFGDVPAWGHILKEISKFEAEFNGT